MTDRPIRVLVLNERDPLHPKAGGAEVHVAEVARHMAGLGFELTQAACSFAGAAASEELPGLRVRRLGPLAAYYLRAVAFTARETRRGAYDVVVEHLNKLPFCAALYSAAPVLAVNHHLFGSSAYLQVSWPIATAVVTLERLIPRVYRKLPFLAVSRSSKDDLVARGIPAAHIAITHNGIRFPSLTPAPLSARPLRVAYLGRLEPYKRVELLLRAVAQLASRFPTLELLLVGRGSARKVLEREARQLGIEGRTRFTGFVSDDERDALVASARVCVCPSVKEGWGITVIEANAVGTPVVATDAPGLRDAVQEGETGLLVADGPPDAFVARLVERVGALLEDTELSARLSAGALAWSKRFGWEVTARDTANAVRSALTQKF